MSYHILPLSEISKLLKTTPEGLDSVSAAKLLNEFGKNKLEDIKKKTVWQMLLDQLADFMISILIAAAVVSGFLGDVVDMAVILTIILINAAAGFLQEFRAEKAMDALKKMSPKNTHVLRDNKPLKLDVSVLVPGDVVLLQAGDIIPADIRFIETHTLRVDESSLTGEPGDIEKNPDELPDGEYSLGDRLNMGYKGSSVTKGNGTAYVVATGMNTELGRIARLIQTEEAKTPLQKKLTDFGKRLTVIIIVICAGFFAIGWIKGENFLTILLTSISLAVAAIPEAMPAVVSIALALGAKRLVKNNALIRKLSAVETVGSVTYICTDKTGTLTINKMTVEKVYEADNLPIEQTFGGSNVLMNAICLNNDAVKSKDGKWIGDSTETALADYAISRNFERNSLETKYPRIAELPFDAERKCMTTLHQTGGGVVVVTKGAAGVLLAKINEQQKHRVAEFESVVNRTAEKGFRVLGYAIKVIDRLPDMLGPEEIESSLTFIGFAAMIDPLREEVKQAVQECKDAGIKPVMITGDHKLTAKAIAERLGIVSTEEDIIIDGLELAKMNHDEFNGAVEKIRVYARVNPEQKLRIVSALQEKGQWVAMTGDGVNDAPALKNADIGIAMGINGTEVAKEASDLILLDDNFATIVKAVKHGRTIFDNILKFIRYILSGNLGEILAIILAPSFSLPIPLLAIHILWVNLVSDGLPGLALASERSDENVMKRPPRDPKQNIFSGILAWNILWTGFLIAVVTIGIEAWAIRHEIKHWQTMAFTVLCFSQMGLAMAVRSEQSVFKIGLLSNRSMLVALASTLILQMAIIYLPVFNDIFRTQPLSMAELAITLAVSSIIFWVTEADKFFRRLFTGRTKK